MKKIYDILVSFLGESKQGCFDSNNYQYEFNCPCCTEINGGIPDGKYNLEVNLQILKYNCWKCADTDGTKGNLSKLIKTHGNPFLYREYKDELDFIRTSKLYDINLGNEIPIIKEEFTIKLPKTFTKIENNRYINRRLNEYLIGRGIGPDIISKFNLGYTTWDEDDFSLRNRLIIPSYDEYGELNYWVGRDFTGKQRDKYKNCTADKKEIIFQESTINWDMPIILVEGAIDCLMFPNSIALLGKSLKRDSAIYQKIIEKSNSDIIIALDNDTDISETRKIYRMLNFGRLRNKVYYIRLDKYKDFGELYQTFGYKGPIYAIKQAQHFKEIDLLE